MIKESIDELDKIKKEITRNNLHNRTLRKRINELEMNIIEYLHSKNQPGATYNGRAIIIEKKEKVIPKKKKEKEQAIINMFGEIGINDPLDTYYNKLVNVQKGEIFETEKLKFKKLTKKKL